MFAARSRFSPDDILPLFYPDEGADGGACG